jgi:hypothetical protein
LQKPKEAVTVQELIDPAAHSSEALRTSIAECDEELVAADSLVRSRYSARGYAMLEADSAAAPATPAPVTLLARAGGRLLGTLTVRRDGPGGLLAEGSYAEEVRTLRAAGHRLGEVVKLATVEGTHWTTALDALVRSAYLLTRVVYGLSDVIIEVNPRHAGFYRRVYGFVEAGGRRLCDRVRAPSILMRLDLEQFGRRLREAA